MDFYDVPTKSWKPFDQLTDQNLPSEIIYSKLYELAQVFKTNKLTYKLLTYPFFDKEFYGNHTEELVQSPIILDCRVINEDNAFYFVEYDFNNKQYCLYKGRRMFNMMPVLMASFLKRFDPEKSCLDMVQIDSLIVKSNDTKIIVNEVLNLIK